MATPSLGEETAKAVLRQVEFYFSESNIPRDHFLKKKIKESEDGMVSLALICSFSKMKAHLKLSAEKKAEDIPEATLKAVAETLRNSSSLKVSEDGKSVGRISELLEPEELLGQLDSRTIAASPFEFDVQREDIEAFFRQYGQVNSVRLPRLVANKKYFCGTALIEFSTEEDAEKVLGQSLVFSGAELELKPKKDFDAIREKEEEEFEASGDGHSNAKEKYPKGLVVAFTLNSLSSGDSAEQNASDEVAKDDANACEVDGELGNANGSSEQKTTDKDDVDSEQKTTDKDGVDSEQKTTDKDGVDSEQKTTDKDGVDSEQKTTDTNSEDKEETDVENVVSGHKMDVKGSIQSVKEKEDKSTVALYKNDMNVVLREDLKDVFKKFGTVKFVDFKAGEKKGYIRFDTPEEAQKARAAAVLAKEGGLVVKNFIATLEPVTGDAEREYWSSVRDNQDKLRGSTQRHHRGGRKHFNGGKHTRNRDRDSPAGRSNKFRKF